MFSGIVETIGILEQITEDGQNKHFKIKSSICPEIYIDQSISHNGVCLTVVKKSNDDYTVTAIFETLIKSNLGDWKVGELVNLERSLLANSRMDGHFVQGHVDTHIECIEVEEADGSWYFRFYLPEECNKLVVPKGSICINGVSLTIAEINKETISVAIIPYTYENTNFKNLSPGAKANIEFDILGKYIINYLDKLNSVV